MNKEEQRQFFLDSALDAINELIAIGALVIRQNHTHSLGMPTQVVKVKDDYLQLDVTDWLQKGE